MPRTAITQQQITSAGITPANEPANALGNSVRPAQGRFLYVKNGSGSGITVTVPTPLTVDGLAVADRAHTVAAGAERMVSMAPQDVYRQPGGEVNVDYSAVTTVSVAVFDVV